MFITSFLYLNEGFWLFWGSSKVIFANISQNFIKSPLKICIISQIPVRSLCIWHICLPCLLVIHFCCLTLSALSVGAGRRLRSLIEVLPEDLYIVVSQIIHSIMSPLLPHFLLSNGKKSEFQQTKSMCNFKWIIGLWASRKMENLQMETF